MAVTEDDLTTASARDMANLLQYVLDYISGDAEVASEMDVSDLVGAHFASYEAAGILTRDKGVVARLRDHSEYQISVMRRR